MKRVVLVSKLMLVAIFWVPCAILRLLLLPFPSDKDFEENEEDTQEILPMQQLFTLTDTTSLIVDHVELCPEETAFIRILSEDSYSPLYKRKVCRNSIGDRWFMYNNSKMFLDNKNTQPIVPRDKEMEEVSQ